MPTLLTLLLTLFALLGQTTGPVDLQAILDAAQPGSVVEIPAGVHAAQQLVQRALVRVGPEEGHQAVERGEEHDALLAEEHAARVGPDPWRAKAVLMERDSFQHSAGGYQGAVGIAWTAAVGGQ